MDTLNVNNLIQAGSLAVSIMGGFQLWRTPHFRGVALLFGLIALASGINILEESGLTRHIYLISPIFIMLFGPATYLAVRKLVRKPLTPFHLWHLLPGFIALFFTAHVQWVIGMGSVWRLVYAVFTTSLLLAYKRKLDEERSDAEEYSLHWLIWIIVLMTLFNFVDLARLNTQHLIAPSINLVGQGINNAAWLIAIMVIATKLQALQELRQQDEHNEHNEKSANTEPARSDNVEKAHYQTLFSELDNTIQSHVWYRTPRLTLHELSQRFGLPPREISRAINLIAQKSFNEYINTFRVQHVCEVLSKTPHKPLNVIADEAGFSSKASFNKTFKHITGETPSAYKSRHHTNHNNG